MISKLIFIIFIIIVTFFVSSLYIKRYCENFSSYKSHLVQLKKEVINPIKIAVGNIDEYPSKFSKIYSYKFPMLRYTNDGGAYNSLTLVANGECDMCITNLELAESLYKGAEPYTTKNKDIRIVCNLNDISLIFMANPNFNITNSTDYLTLGELQSYTEPITIAVDNSDIGIYYILMKILNLYNFNLDNITVVEEDIFNDTDVLNDFQDGNITILVANIIHPDERIKNLYQQYNFRFIGIDDLYLSKLHVKSQYYKRTSINLMDYDVELHKNRMLDVFSCPLCIICDMSVDEKTIYRFVNGLFENIEYIRTNYKKANQLIEQNNDFYNIQDYKNTENQQINTLLPSSYYNIRSLIPIHEGTKKYLKEIGLITTVDNKFCQNYLPDGNPANIQRFFENCNSQPILKELRHYGYGHFG